MDENAAPPFADWVEWVFDWPVDSRLPWYWDDDDGGLEPRLTPMDQALYATRLFADAGTLVALYSDDQVARGLEYLSQPIVADYANAPFRGDVEEDLALAYVDALPELFAQVFVPRCPDRLGHLDEESSELSGCCYMWWDRGPWAPGRDFPAAPRIDEHMFRTLERVLALP